MVNVLALNCEEHEGLLRALTAELPVQLALARFDLPWEEIAARRRGLKTGRAVPIPAELAQALAKAEVVFGFSLPTDATALAPRLRWVETPATGFDQLRFTGVLENPSIAVTTVGGLFAPEVAEHAFALLLGLSRRLPFFVEAQRNCRWLPGPVTELRGRTLAIVGLGNIGTAVARLARAFGMVVVATRPRRQTPPSGLVDRLYDRSELREMLSVADVVVVSVTGAEANRGLIGARELQCMKRSAFLINVSRGFVLEEDALIAALRDGLIAGAGLDVFVEEPLPASSPLWSLPNVLLTPHVAITLASRLPRCIEHFAENLARYCRGEALRDLVEPSARPNSLSEAREAGRITG